MGKREKTMKRLDKKVLISIITAMLCVTAVYADAEEDLLLGVKAPPTVSIEKTSESVEEGSTTPGSGVVSNDLKSVFTLQTTGTDSDYDFILTSSINIQGDTVSAYGKNGSILFTNVDNLPTLSAVNDAKAWGTNNPNVLVYPLSVVVESPMSVVHKEASATYGNCYVVNVNSGTGGKVTNTVSSTPISGTYDVTFDSAGTYQSSIIFTAFGK